MDRPRRACKRIQASCEHSYFHQSCACVRHIRCADGSVFLYCSGLALLTSLLPALSLGVYKVAPLTQPLP